MEASSVTAPTQGATLGTAIRSFLGKYGLIIARALRVMAVATMLLLGGFVGLMLIRERKRARYPGPLPVTTGPEVQP